MKTIRIRRGGNGVFEEIEVNVLRITKTQVVLAMPSGISSMPWKKFSRTSGYPIGEQHGFGFRAWFIVHEDRIKLNEEMK